MAKNFPKFGERYKFTGLRRCVTQNKINSGKTRVRQNHNQIALKQR